VEHPIAHQYTFFFILFYRADEAMLNFFFSNTFILFFDNIK